MITTRTEGIDFVERLVATMKQRGRVEGDPVLGKFVRHKDYPGSASLVVEDADDRIEVEVGCPKWMHHRNDRPPEQVLLRARRAERGSYGCHNDLVRVFKINPKTKDVNGAGIIRAIDQLAAMLLKAKQDRLERDAEWNRKQRERLSVGDRMRELGLAEGWQKCGAWLSLSDNGSLRLELKDLSLERALEVITQLNLLPEQVDA